MSADRTCRCGAVIPARYSFVECTRCSIQAHVAWLEAWKAAQAVERAARRAESLARIDAMKQKHAAEGVTPEELQKRKRIRKAARADQVRRLTIRAGTRRRSAVRTR